MISPSFSCISLLSIIWVASCNIIACNTKAYAKPLNSSQVYDARVLNDESHLITKNTTRQQHDFLQDDYEQASIRKQLRLQYPRRLSLKLGFGPKYLETQPDEFPMNLDYQHITPFSQAMLAYRFNVRKTGRKERGHAVGVFIQRGQNNELTIGQLIRRNDIPIMTFLLNGQHQYLELEAGIVLSEWLRISSGKGKQTFRTHGGSENHTYYTTTLGTSARLGIIEFDIAGTGFWGGFYKKPAIRANLSINIHLKAGRW